jgi:hypothetical protein
VLDDGTATEFSVSPDPVTDYTEDYTVDVAWSPDGQALAIAGLFDATNWGTRLMIVNADGTGLSAVPGIEAARDPSWKSTR